MDSIINKEFKGCIDYFLDCHSKDDFNYGLVRDRFPSLPNFCSIAATGFGLAMYAIAVEYGYITKEQGYEIVDRTIDTLNKLEKEQGYFYHFYNSSTLSIWGNSELSNIDSTLLYMGLIVAGEYFGGQIKDKAYKILNEVNWHYFEDKQSNTYFMGKRKGGNFYSHWNFYSEQLAMYVLAEGTPTNKDRVGMLYYDTFVKQKGRYKDYEFIYTWCGSLFTHQFSHAFIDFRNILDSNGINWHNNSVIACKAAHQFCNDNEQGSKSYSSVSWGLSACDAKGGYVGRMGTPPSGNGNKMHLSDGTVAPYAAIASIAFTPDLSINAANYFYTLPKLVGEYGLKDSFNLDQDWFAIDYIGIDKGITALMIVNFDSEFVWKQVSKSSIINDGLVNLKFTKK